jgi:hypothetical protein
MLSCVLAQTDTTRPGLLYPRHRQASDGSHNQHDDDGTKDTLVQPSTMVPLQRHRRAAAGDVGRLAALRRRSIIRRCRSRRQCFRICNHDDGSTRLDGSLPSHCADSHSLLHSTLTGQSIIRARLFAGARDCAAVCCGTRRAVAVTLRIVDPKVIAASSNGDGQGRLCRGRETNTRSPWVLHVVCSQCFKCMRAHCRPTRTRDV